MRRPLHLATFLFACAAIAPACLLDAGPYQDSTGGSGAQGGGTGGVGNTTTSGNSTTTTPSTGGGGNGGTGGVASICGDGAITGDEQCDDDNTAAGDGCSPTCTIEPGYACTGEPSVCEPTCGNGEIEADKGEQCDDENITPGDGCSQGCQIEEGYICEGEPSVCEKTCGNSKLDDPETCDDGNDTPGDGCSATCQREDGWYCDNDPLPSHCFAICGDGIIIPGEEGCDDGDADGTSKCNQACSGPVAGWECDSVTGGPNSCTPICGDALVVEGEACDDGNANPGDGCSAACALEATCGNNIVDPGEECDGDGSIAGECNNCKLVDQAQAVCKDAPLIPTGSFNAGDGTFEIVYEGSNDPDKGNGMPIDPMAVPSPAECDTSFNAPVLHRYVTGDRPSFLILETLATQPVSNQPTFTNTQIWVYRDCPRKADYEGCNNDAPAMGKRSRFTTGYLPAKTTVFIVISGEGPGGAADNGYYALKITERPVKLFYHEDFSSVTMPGVHDLVPGLTEVPVIDDGGWKTCFPAFGIPCLSKEPPSHSGGAFAWASSATMTALTANVLTPVLDLSGLTAARASYAYRITDSPANELGKVESLNGNAVSGAVTYNPPAAGRTFVTMPTSQNAALRFVYENGSSAAAGHFTIDDIRIYGY